MRIRKKPWAEPELAACDFYIKNPAETRGNWSKVFEKQQPLHLELGCGKGSFVARAALAYPHVNFIAVDIKSDMLGVGRRNIVKFFQEAGKTVDDVKNIALVAWNVEQIEKIISPEDKIERIYINFCNPWPRGKHKKRRLTFPLKLMKYREFLEEGGEIRFKTDDDELFEESLEYFEECGFRIDYITRDLHNSDFSKIYGENFMTEHERMFSQEGIRIKYCTAVKDVLPEKKDGEKEVSE